MASADEDSMLKYKDFTPQDILAISEEERGKAVPFVYILAAGTGVSKGSELLFSSQLNTLMYPGIGNYKSAVKQYQKDLGDKETGILTVSQIYKLEKRSEFQKLSRVSFPAQYISFKTQNVATVKGTMMLHDEDIAFPVNATELSCYKADNYCELKQLFLSFPKVNSWGANFSIESTGRKFFQITSWDENTIDAVPSDPGSGCRKTSLNLNFKTKEFYEFTRNGDKDCKINGVSFPKLKKPRIGQIVDGEKIINAEFSKLNKLAFEMLSANYQNAMTKLIESELGEKSSK